MHINNAKNEVILKNLNAFCDIEYILCLPFILPLLETMRTLVKIAQGKDVFICNFVDVVELAQQELYRLYCDPYAKFEIHLSMILILLSL